MVGGHQHYRAVAADAGEPLLSHNGVDPAEYCPGCRGLRSVVFVRTDSLLPGAGGAAEELHSGAIARHCEYSGLIDSLQQRELPA